MKHVYTLVILGFLLCKPVRTSPPTFTPAHFSLTFLWNVDCMCTNRKRLPKVLNLYTCEWSCDFPATKTSQPPTQIWPIYLGGLRKMAWSWICHKWRPLSSPKEIPSSSWSLLTKSGSFIKLSPTTSLGDVILWKVSKAKWLLGFLFRNSDPPCLAKLYKLTTVPHLDYCCCVWDPHHTTHVKQLKSAQSFAAKIVTTDWTTDTEILKSRLHSPSLRSRQLTQNLCLCWRIICGSSVLPPTFSSCTSIM